MYKIGEFSILAKCTIKTLRYYESEGLLIPSFIDSNGYRYYESSKLSDLIKVISLRQLGFSIKEIKDVQSGKNFNDLLILKKQLIEKELIETESKLKKINKILEEKKMNYEVIMKDLPDYVVYYMEGKVKDFNGIVEFILNSAKECEKINPGIKCIEPSYCYLNYLDGEYKEKDFMIKYAQAVVKEGKSNDIIKFEKLKPMKSVCIYHKGSYSGLREAYNFIMKYIEDNHYEIAESPRERYIDGMWNKDNEEDWLTEIQVPIK